MRDWYYQTRHWTSKPWVKVLVVLFMLVIISFVPTLLTDSHNLQITEGDEFIIQDIPPDEDGVSQTSSEATCQDGPSNLHPPDSDSQPCFPF